MTILKRPVPVKKIVFTLVAASLLLLVAGCAKKTNFATSSVVPAARGYVKIKKDNNKNYAIRVHLSNLAEVSRLQPPKKTYVVWVESDNGITTNVGQIKSSSGRFSTKLKASFETVSTSRPVKVFVTAENDPDTTYPDTQVILDTGKL